MPSTHRKSKELFKLRSSIDQRKIKFVTNDGRVKKKAFCSDITLKNLAQCSSSVKNFEYFICVNMFCYI